MNFIFIHNNYPAQFRNLAALLGANKANDVIFMTMKEVTEQEKIEGVKTKVVKLHRKVSEKTHHYLHATEEAILIGQAIVRELVELKEKGYKADFIITHGGNGNGLFVKDVFPNAISIGYFEWYFRPETTRFLIREFDLDTQLRTKMRNLVIHSELEACDYAVVPTKWQKKQFPKEYQQKMEIIFDGIDRTFFRRQNETEKGCRAITISNRETGEKFEIGEDEKIMSYATRGMEPLRGFPEFMKAVPYMLERFENLKIVIAGADRRAYSYDAPDFGGSWKEYCMSKIKEERIRERIIFCGLLNYNDYRKLLWRSDLHCYFTRPYVTSWSLFEATACGAKVITNKIEATDEIAEVGTIELLNLDEEVDMRKKIDNCLRRKDGKKGVLKKEYELENTIRRWQELLNRALGERNSVE